MEVDTPTPAVVKKKGGKDGKKRFEVKKVSVRRLLDSSEH
jgi:hypothetical protein